MSAIQKDTTIDAEPWAPMTDAIRSHISAYWPCIDIKGNRFKVELSKDVFVTISCGFWIHEKSHQRISRFYVAYFGLSNKMETITNKQLGYDPNKRIQSIDDMIAEIEMLIVYLAK